MKNLSAGISQILGGLFISAGLIGIYRLIPRLMFKKKGITSELNLSPKNLKYFFLGALMSGLLSCFSLGVIAVIGRVHFTQGSAWVIALSGAIFMAAVTSVLEELIFRGFLFRLVEKFTNQWWALAFTSIIFGGLHFLNLACKRRKS